VYALMIVLCFASWCCWLLL